MTCTWLMPDAPDKHGRAFRPGALLITHAPKIEQKQNKEELLLVPGGGLAFSRSKVKRTIHTRRGGGRRLRAGSMVRNEDNTPKLKMFSLWNACHKLKKRSLMLRTLMKTKPDRKPGEDASKRLPCGLYWGTSACVIVLFIKHIPDNPKIFLDRHFSSCYSGVP